MSRAELDHAHSARDTVPDFTPFLQRYAPLSAQAREMPGVQEAMPYGADARERLDIFPADFREVAEHNHFDNIFGLADVKSRLSQEFMDQVRHD